MSSLKIPTLLLTCVALAILLINPAAGYSLTQAQQDKPSATKTASKPDGKDAAQQTNGAPPFMQGGKSASSDPNNDSTTVRIVIESKSAGSTPAKDDVATQSKKDSAAEVLDKESNLNSSAPSTNPAAAASGVERKPLAIKRFSVAATFTVTSTGDADDPSTSDGKCDIDPGTPEEECTLRAAITQANFSPGVDAIIFNLAGNIPTIRVGISTGRALPTIIEPVIIEGTNPALMIELDGSSAGSNSSGLYITAGNCIIHGLVINGFSGNGIKLETNGGNTIQGNFIGTNSAGTGPRANAAEGIAILNSPGNTIGGETQTTPDGPCSGECNILSGNRNGIRIYGTGSSGNIVKGNFMGTDVNGTTAIPNSTSGIIIGSIPNVRGSSPSGNVVGGPTPKARNLISGNTGPGIQIYGIGATNNRVIGNYIGTKTSGTMPLPNRNHGVLITEPVEFNDDPANNNEVGGTVPGEGNLISGNNGEGVQLAFNAHDNKVIGNFIGTAANGIDTMGNSRHGIQIFLAPANKIGLADPAARNIISGNGSDGIRIFGLAAKENEVKGNYIGTDKTGTVKVSNISSGITISDAPSNIIGGPMPATLGGSVPNSGNLISGNAGLGIGIAGANATGNIVKGNLIGTKFNGTEKLENNSAGVVLSIIGTDAASKPSFNQIGGTAFAERNVISGNAGDGINIRRGSHHNKIWGNLIGTDYTGQAALSNTANGVAIFDSPSNEIGGDGLKGNVISANRQNGILIGLGGLSAGATGNVILGNLIGTDMFGTVTDPDGLPDSGDELGNALAGVSINTVSGNHVGGVTRPELNVISGNLTDGVQILGNARDNTVTGNLIGTDFGGSQPLGNHQNGVLINSLSGSSNSPVNNLIGGDRGSMSTGCDGPCNVISGNKSNGVLIGGVGTITNKVQGNYIGSNLAGTDAIPNGDNGVVITNGATENTIGGDRGVNVIECKGPCNIISGNNGAGVGMQGAGTSSNLVLGNYIGVKPDGDTPMPNGSHGIYISDRNTGPLDQEVAYAVASNYSQSSWPNPDQVDPDEEACNVKQSGGGEGLKQAIKGFFFELRMNQEKKWTRSPAPNTPIWDAVQKKIRGVDGVRRWQIKAFALNSSSNSCANALGLLPKDKPDVCPDDPNALCDLWGLALPKDTVIGDCGSSKNQQRLDDRRQKGRIVTSDILLEAEAYKRVSDFVERAMRKPDCPSSNAAGAPITLNVIGGNRQSPVCDGSCNIIGGNAGYGISIHGAGAISNIAKGNYIGVNASGLTPLSNKSGGVEIYKGSQNKIGDERSTIACDGPCNVISGNGLDGVMLHGSLSQGNFVQGNYIGVNAIGGAGVPNVMAGVAVRDGASQNFVGGPRADSDCKGPCNVISGNGTDGVLFWAEGTTGNLAQGNFIGVKADASALIGNRRYGVVAGDGASQNFVGANGTPSAGVCQGPCNLIRGNSGGGVAVIGNATQDVSIRGNAIYGNGGLGIDLDDDGATRNDSGDADTGANNLINFPILNARFDGTRTMIQGSLDTQAPTLASIDFYAGGQTTPLRLLGSVTPGSDGAFTFEVDGEVQNLKATTTTPSGSTSELSSSARPPLIFIPGVGGSRLAYGNPSNELWPELLADRERLTLFPNDPKYTPDVAPTDVIRDMGLIPIYSRLLDALKDPKKGGYVEYARTDGSCNHPAQQGENPNLFIFAYDWRKSIEHNAQKLKDYVDCIQLYYPGSQIDILAHSMGGLVARRYILDNLNDHKVNKLITAGAPWLGTPDPLYILQTGNWVPLLLGPTTAAFLMNSTPGPQQLLPAMTYYDMINNLPVSSPDRLLPLIEDGWDIDGNGRSDDHFTYEQYHDVLDGIYGFDRSNPRRKVRFPGTETDTFHAYPHLSGNNQDDWRLDSTGIKYYHLYGVEAGEKTIAQLQAAYARVCHRDPNLLHCLQSRYTFRPIFRLGDGTVSLMSTERCTRATPSSPCENSLNAPNTTQIPFPERNSILPLPPSEWVSHFGLMLNSEFHSTVISIISETATNSSRRTQQTVPDIPPPAPYYYLTVMGATSITARDPQGNTSQPATPFARSALPEVGTYTLGDKYDIVTMPVSGTYAVTFQTSTDPLELEIRTGTGSTTTSAIRYIDLTAPAGVNAILRFSTQGVDDLLYDSDGDGSFETHVAPTISINGNQASDITAPTISVNTSTQSNGVMVTLTAQDNESGVSAIYYSLNDTDFQRYTAPFQVDPAQNPTLSVLADDNVGNRQNIVFTFPVSPLSGDLGLVAASPNSVVTGSNITYSLNVMNNGPDTAQSITLTDNLPSDLTFVSCNATGGGVCEGSSNNRAVNFTSLAAGTSATVTIVASVNCSVADGTVIPNTVTVSSTTADSVSSNNSATVNVTASNLPPTITPFADITVAAAPDQCSAVVNYATPTASDNCSGVTVACSPPSGSTFAAGTTTVTCSATDSGGATASASFMITVNAAVSLAPSTQAFHANGGNGTFNVTAGSACNWVAVSNATFIIITSGGSGTGNGTVEFTVSASNGPRTGTITVAGQTFTVNQTAPTAVNLISLVASAYDAGVLIQWQTGFEVNNLGFNIYHENSGQRSLVTPEIIAGSALMTGRAALTAGKSYGWWHAIPNDKQGGVYWLEDIDINGTRTMHGPFTPQIIGGKPPAQSQADLLSRLGRGEAKTTQLPPVQQSRPAATLIEKQPDLASKTAVKLTIREEGWYRVDQEELIRAGLDPKTDPRTLQVYLDGIEQPVLVTGELDGSFDKGDSVEFYAFGQDIPSSDAHVYWLVSSSARGKRVGVIKSHGGPGGARSFLYTAERKERTIYFSSLTNGDAENFFGPVIASQPVTQKLMLSHLDAKAPADAEIEVALQGVTDTTDAAPDHVVEVAVNGSAIGRVVFSGRERKIEQFSIKQELLSEGENTVTLTAGGSSPDVSLVDHIRVTYWHTYTADNDTLRMAVEPQSQIGKGLTQTIGGFASPLIRVIDITDSSAVQEVVGLVEQGERGYEVTVDLARGGSRALLGFTADRIKHPDAITLNQPSNWQTPKHGADMLIITRREFGSALEPLKRLRQRQGLSVEVVDIEDIYDEFSFGNKSPQAMKDFINYAATSWKKKPRFILLAADASHDSRNYLGFGDHDIVPTKLVDTAFMETSSDDWFADFNNDGLAELAVGRLPFRTASEALNLISKIIGYEQTEPSQEVIIVADANDGFDFESESRELVATLPASLRVNQINRGQLDAATAKSQLIEAINRGQKIVNYMGHGSVRLWRGNLLTSEDAAELINERHLSLFVMMTCLNGYFADPALESLAESLMNAERGGAVAVWASSGQCLPNEQTALNKELYSLMFGETGSQTLGEATRQAKLKVSDSDIRRTWILFGDPAMRLK